MSTSDLCSEILDDIIERTNGLPTDELLMALLYVSENCKAYAESILAHEYHRALYGRDER